MRLIKTIFLDNQRAATVKELRVKDMRKLLAGFNGLTTISLTDLLGDRYEEVKGLIEPFFDLPDGEVLDDLTGSEIQLLIDGFKEVNADFLALAGLILPPEINENCLTDPVAS
jgi:hypothetical protein